MVSLNESSSINISFDVHVANSHDFQRMGELFDGKAPFDVAFQDGAHSHQGVLMDLDAHSAPAADLHPAQGGVRI